MIILDLIAMTAAEKVNLIGVVVLFALIPLAIFDENPGFGVGAWLQIGSIILVVAWMGLRFLRQPTRSRCAFLGLAYPISTATSNFAAFLIVPDLMH
jgi:hypothetical protein